MLRKASEIMKESENKTQGSETLDSFDLPTNLKNKNVVIKKCPICEVQGEKYETTTTKKINNPFAKGKLSIMTCNICNGMTFFDATKL